MTREEALLKYVLRLGDNALILAFFRSQGMTAGRLIPLELEIGPQA